MPYKSYVRNSSTHMTTDSYLYLPRHLENFMMRNSRGLVRMHKKSTKNIPNLHVCYTDERQSKIVQMIVCSTE